MAVNSFFACFGQFYFLSQTAHFATAFSKTCHFSNVRCVFFVQNSSKVFVQSLFAVLFFEPNCAFCQGYCSLCLMANLATSRKLVISQILGVFWRLFLHRGALKCF